MKDPSARTKGLRLLRQGDGETRLRDAIQGLSGMRLQERILQLPDPRQVLQGLAPIDFYWVVKKVGEEDSFPLLELASTDQWEHLLDLEIWRRDRIDLEQTGSWLKRLYKADGRRLARWLMEEGELLGRLYLSRLLDVMVKDQDTEIVPDGFFTLDDVYYLRVRDPGQTGWIQELTADMARLDYDAYLRLLLGLVERLPSDMEEELYRFRGTRLAECGFLPFDEALSVYSPLDPEAVMGGGPGVPTVVELAEEEEELVPMVPWDHGVEGGLLAKAVEEIDDSGSLDRLRLEFANLANQLISAEGMPVMDLEVLKWACKRAASYVNLGLERLTKGDVSNASDLLTREAVVTIFRVGFGMALRLQWEAKGWVKRSWFKRMGLGTGFWGEAWGATLSGLLRKRPLYSLGEKEGEQQRDFRRLAEIEEATRVLARLEALDDLMEALAERHPLDPALVDHPEATFHPLLFNLWGRDILGMRPEMAPLGLDQARDLFTILRRGDRRAPYRMPGFQERFVAFFLDYAPDPSRGTLSQTLSMIWREFTEEYERVPLEELDRRFMRLIHPAS